MGTNTPNLNLYKPDPSELVNVSRDLNNNYDKIDAESKLLRDREDVLEDRIIALEGALGLSDWVELPVGPWITFWSRSSITPFTVARIGQTNVVIHYLLVGRVCFVNFKSQAPFSFPSPGGNNLAVKLEISNLPVRRVPSLSISMQGAVEPSKIVEGSYTRQKSLLFGFEGIRMLPNITTNADGGSSVPSPYESENFIPIVSDDLWSSAATNNQLAGSFWFRGELRG